MLDVTVTLYLVDTVFCGTIKVTDALCFLIFIWQEKKMVDLLKVVLLGQPLP